MSIIKQTELSKEDKKELIALCKFVYPYKTTGLLFGFKDYDGLNNIVLVVDKDLNTTIIHYYELCIKYLIPEIGSKQTEYDYDEFFDLMMYEDEETNIINNLFNFAILP